MVSMNIEAMTSNDLWLLNYQGGGMRLDPFVTFKVTYDEIVTEPKNRQPEKTMVWVMNELKQEYKKWQDEQKT
jgi:hypothetical protein